MTWGNSDLFRSAGQTWNCRSKPKVRKSKNWLGYWLVTNHYLGPRQFPTWREAMDYANVQTYTINNGAKL